jgi:hypothetical protein
MDGRESIMGECDCPQPSAGVCRLIIRLKRQINGGGIKCEESDLPDGSPYRGRQSSPASASSRHAGQQARVPKARQPRMLLAPERLPAVRARLMAQAPRRWRQSPAELLGLASPALTRQRAVRSSGPTSCRASPAGHHRTASRAAGTTTAQPARATPSSRLSTAPNGRSFGCLPMRAPAPSPRSPAQGPPAPRSGRP